MKSQWREATVCRIMTERLKVRIQASNRRLCPPLAPTDIRAFAPQGPVPLAQSAQPMCRGRPPRSSLPHGRQAESFADDINMQRGIVSGRVALLPQSTQIQPRIARIRPSPLHPHSKVQARKDDARQRYCEQGFIPPPQGPFKTSGSDAPCLSKILRANIPNRRETEYKEKHEVL